MAEHSAETVFRDAIAAALAIDGAAPDLRAVRIDRAGPDAGERPGWFPVTDLATTTLAAAAAALAEAISARRPQAPPPALRLDRRRAALWFAHTLRPLGWSAPPAWNPISGDYRTREGWIRIHANVPAHRRAALETLLGAPAREDPAAVEAAVARWDADALEGAIVAAGGAAARMRSTQDWGASAPGRAVAAEPLIAWTAHPEAAPDGPAQPSDPRTPLAGLQVLDLTRVLAGPAATRFLAAWGADVLRIDPPDWDEPENAVEMTLGKRCAGLDLRLEQDRARFETLLTEADLLVSGYRPGALDALGYDAAALRALNPALIDIRLDAYGWSGPWAGRRGFDSLVQMSSGIAHHGMTAAGADRPTPLPVQALDHAVGYLAAAAALSAVAARARTGAPRSARLSLARIAALLVPTARTERIEGGLTETPEDLDPRTEPTVWGPLRRVRFPLTLDGAGPVFAHPAGPLRTAAPAWRDR